MALFLAAAFFLVTGPLADRLDQTPSTVLLVYRSRITLERGIFSKCYREFFVRDIRSIDIDQSILARLVNIGDLTISTAASQDATEDVEGVPGPRKIRDLIIAQRQTQ